MAAVKATIHVKGLAELDRMLKRLPDIIEERIMRDALEVGGEMLRKAAVSNIHSRSGRTAADIKVEIQQPKNDEGVAAVGGTIRGGVGRAFVLRWLEFGTRPHIVLGGAEDRRQARKAARALRRIGNREAALALQRGLRSGAITMRRALKLPGGIFRASAGKKNPIFMAAQSPLTRALIENFDDVLKVVGETTWKGIVRAVPTIKAGG
jgi:HK97 gp10 family phage protein